MAINFLPLGNAIDLVTSAVTDSITGSAITDAILTAVLKTEGGVTLATSSALTHTSGGVYKGTFDISGVSLTLNTHYYLAVAASNYALQWKHLYRAEDRPLQGSGSAAIDTTPGTSGLGTITGIAKGDGAGGFTGLAVPLTAANGGTGRTTIAGFAPRQATLVIAASDSVNQGGANFICTGTDDQTTIDSAIAALPAGGTLLFRDGKYICSAATTAISTANIHLCGESHPYFAAWGGGYPNYDTPGNPGGAQIRFLGAVSYGFGLAASGIVLESLYIVNTNAGQTAYGYNTVGAYATGDHCKLIDCFIQGWAVDVDWLSDSSDIFDCNIGNSSTIAIRLYYGSINVSNNVIYANNGYGIYSLLGVDAGARIINNQLGVNGVAISVGQKRTVIANNVIAATSIASNDLIQIRSGAHGCTITGNTLQISSNFDGSAAVVNTSGNGVNVGSDGAANNCVIQGNYIDNAGLSNSSGYAIAFHNSSTKCTAIGNVIPAGKFNSAGSATILWGTGNIGATLNAGDA